ncbi:DUF58 domain-containing protein [Halorussus litoreus]|uniref:DUF58 domain-containing protein n=1 Tax=Halorussus litoreus TaxID=1710536 RepID=UPI001E54F96C|nr:DUF58 domain-containing protein [Halorussus litoreus]
MSLASEIAVLLGFGVLVAVYYAAFDVTRARASPASARAARKDAEAAETGKGGTAEDASDEMDAEDADSADDAATDSDEDDSVVRTTGPRWAPGTTVGLLAGAAGLLTNNTTVFLAGVVGFAYTAYRSGTEPPDPDLSAEREIDDRSPAPSREIEVTLTVRNDGETTVPDLRIVDGVPEKLAVTSGSPRFCTGLRPGESASFSYRVRARRGTHEFGATTLVARNVSGSAERRFRREIPATVTSESRPGDVPLPADTSSHPGHITTDSGGEGVEFYATREHHPSDPPSRIDWKRYARTRELTTVEFRETRAATVMVVVDARRAAHVARRDGEPDAVALCEYVAERLAGSLLRRNDRVGLAVYGPPEAYLAPGGGDEQSARVRATLRDADTPFEPQPVGLFRERRRSRTNETRFDTLRKRMPAASQVIFLSPMADDFAADVAKRFRAYGHAVTVLSPDVSGDTPGGSVEGIERAERLSSVRESDVRVVDWSPDEPLRNAVEAATARWSS